jgi:hypothetical protein
VKSERKVGPALRGFGVRDFGVYEHTTHKQNETGKAEMRNAIRVWAQQFRVSGFTNSRCKNTAQRQRQITKTRKGMGPSQYRVSMFGNA